MRKSDIEKTVAERAFTMRTRQGQHWRWLVQRFHEADAAYYAAFRANQFKE